VDIPYLQIMASLEGAIYHEKPVSPFPTAYASDEILHFILTTTVQAVVRSSTASWKMNVLVPRTARVTVSNRT
jgi:hypothetical protein